MDEMNRTVLVTGGTGYIGSHIVVSLLKSGAQVVVLDNLSNSSPSVVDRLENITSKRPKLIQGDLRDAKALGRLFEYHSIDAVVHCAGLKAVDESERYPLEYYDNNVFGSCRLFEAMAKARIYTLVFSSSATVYGSPGVVQYREDTPLAPSNVYGRTKLMVEDILRDLAKSNKAWSIGILRYFNPIGAHQSGLIGDSPIGTPNNLMPFITQVALRMREKLFVFGGDYLTPDGTPCRDYIHIEDLAMGHLCALEKILESKGLLTVNLGTGRAYSVLEMIAAFEKATGQHIPYQIGPRREGDLSAYFADPSLAKELLGWEARYDIYRMCKDAWRSQRQNQSAHKPGAQYEVA